MRTRRSLPTFVRSAFAFVLTSVSLPALAEDGPAPGEPPSTAPSGAATEAETKAPGAAEAPPADASATPVPAGSPAAGSSSPVEPPRVLPVLATPAAAQKDEVVDEPDDGALRYHQDHFLGFVAARVGKVSSSGFDPFSDSDELPQFSAAFGKTLMVAGNFSLAGLFLYDIGGQSGQARGMDTELVVHRLTLGAEARYHFMRQLFVFGRAAPGAIHSIAKLEDRTAGMQTLEARHWVFATDLSAGAMFELSGWSGDSKKRRPSVWVAVDGGYGFAGTSELSFTADGDGPPERAEPIELGELALAGPFLRFAAVLTY